jgi:sn-glycerol 3-phosphate transport system substrate-binding protein
MSKATLAAVAALAIALPQAALSQDRTQIEWWYGLGGRIGEEIENLIADFNASQDQYTVVGVHKGNYEETFAAMIAAYRVGQHPAIIQATERSVLTMMNSGAIVPMHDLMAEHGHPFETADFIAPIGAYYMFDGTMNAMPFNHSTSIMWYNVEHFAAAGFEGPAATWEEFETQLYAIKDLGLSNCQMVLNSDFVWSLVEGFSTINDLPFGTLANGRDGLATEYVYNTTRVVEQVERLKKWVDDGIIQLAGQGTSPAQMFTSGTCSTWSASTAAHAQVEAEAKFDWSATLQPHLAGVEPRNSQLGGAGLWVLQGKSDAEYEAAAAFMNYIQQPEVQADWAFVTGYVPVTNAAYDLMTERSLFQQSPTREIAILQLLRGEPTDNSWGFRFGNSNQWWAAINEELQAAFAGQKTVQEALDASVVRGNEILRQFERINAGN